MVLVVVTRDGSGKKFISASSIEEVISKAKEKFQLVDGVLSSFKLCVTSGAAEGLEIEDDEIFMELTEARKPELLAVVIVDKDKVWTSDHSSRSESEGEVIQRQLMASPQTLAPESPKCLPLPMGPLLETIDPILKELKMEPPPRNILLKKRRGVKEASKYVSEFIWRHTKNYTFGTCQSYVSALFSYDDGLLKPLFFRSYAGLVHDSGFEALVTSVYNALNHQKSKIRIEAGETPRKRRSGRSLRDVMAEEQLEDDVQECDPKRQKFDDYGCVRHNPPLKPGETSASQEQKRLALLRLRDISEGPEVETLFMETYSTQRSEIVSSRPILNLKKVLLRWPHLLKHRCFYKHASHLLDKDVLDTFLSSLGHNAKDFVRYLDHYWKSSSKVIQGVNQLLDQLDEAVQADRSNTPYSVVLIPLILKYFKEDSEIFFQIVKFDATREEVLAAASRSNSNPIIIVRGHSIFNAEKYEVVFLNDVLMEVPTFMEGVLVSFLFFYVYGLKYPKETQITLEFCQRILLQVNPPSGDKRQRSSRGVPTMNSKLINLLNNLKVFSAPSS